MEGSEQNIRVEKIRTHKRYPKAKPDYDLALLKLANKAKLTPYVRTICLPRGSDRIVIRTNGEGVLPGWGSAQVSTKHFCNVTKTNTRTKNIVRMAGSSLSF